jgi:hypothetical protein
LLITVVRIFRFSARADGPAVTNRVDGAAEVLGVHVRRIYELIKILEILSLVTVSTVCMDHRPRRGAGVSKGLF